MSQKVNLSPVVEVLVKAQNEFDSDAYILLFDANAIVHDEGNAYHGLAEIKIWNEETNKKYAAKLAPTGYIANEDGYILTATVTGNFKGSPAIIRYNFTFENEKIKTLKID